MRSDELPHTGCAMTRYSALLVLCCLLPGRPGHADPPEAGSVRYLEETTRRLLHRCRVTANDGTVLYTPDGKGNDCALWTCDFAYMVENAGDLMPAREVEACIRFLLRGQRRRRDPRPRAARRRGRLRGRVRPDHPLGLANLDNPAFLAIAADEHLKRLPEDRREPSSWSGALRSIGP